MDRFPIGIRSVRRKSEVYNTHTMSYDYKIVLWPIDHVTRLFPCLVTQSTVYLCILNECLFRK